MDACERCHGTGVLHRQDSGNHGLTLPCPDCLIDEHDYDDEDCDPEGPAFECAGFDDGSGFYCPLWGTEECDWECPRGGMG